MESQLQLALCGVHRVEAVQGSGVGSTDNDFSRGGPSSDDDADDDECTTRSKKRWPAQRAADAAERQDARNSTFIYSSRVVPYGKRHPRVDLCPTSAG